MKEQAITPLVAPGGDILVAFDNDQVIGKTYHVRTDNKLKASLITSTCVVEVAPKGTLQASEDLKPGNWQTAENLSKQIGTILDGDSDFNNAVNKTHYKYVYEALTEAISTVASQQIVKNEALRDHVDDEVDERIRSTT